MGALLSGTLRRFRPRFTDLHFGVRPRGHPTKGAHEALGRFDLAFGCHEMYPSRKKFRAQVVPTDPELWAIGMIIVQWSNVEMLSEAFISGLTDEGSQERKEFQATWSASVKLEQLNSLAKKRLLEPWRTEIVGLLADIRSMKDVRDRIVHGSWGGPTGDVRFPTSATAEEKTHLFSWSKPNPFFSQRLNFGKLMEIAYKIEAIQLRIHDFMFNNIDRASGLITLSGALLHRSRKQDQP